MEQDERSKKSAGESKKVPRLLEWKLGKRGGSELAAYSFEVLSRQLQRNKNGCQKVLPTTVKATSASWGRYMQSA